MFQRLFDHEAPQLQLQRVDVVGGDALPDLDGVDGLLVSGSRYDAFDPAPWIGAVASLLRDAYTRNVPTVGICFGHQLIAHALGGRVERASGGWGVGVHQAELTGHGRQTLTPAAPFALIHSHQDQVLELPPGGRVLASASHVPIAALQVGSLLGFQGHPEFRPAYAAALMDVRRDRIPAEVRERAHASLGGPTQHREVAHWIADHLAGTGP